MAYRLPLRKAGWSVSRRCLLPGSQCKSMITWRRVPLVVSRTASSGRSDAGSLEISGIRVEKSDRCVMIRMERGENRLNREFVQAMDQALDAAESYKDAIAVITTGKNKFYSNGLDLEEMQSMSDSENIDSFNDFQKLLARLLTFPMLTVAAINGHVYAAGALFAMVQDYRVMRTGRGWYCLPEVLIKRKFSPGLFEILKARLPQPTLHRAAVLGQRYTAEDAIEAKLVDEVCELTDLENRALLVAADLAGGEPGLDRKTLAAIKRGLYRNAYTALNEPVDKVYTNEFMLK